MKLLRSALFLAAASMALPAIGTSLFANGLQPAESAKAAPNFSVTDLEGKSVSLESLKGKVVVVDFWATWCPPCVAEIPGYVELQKKYSDKLVIVGLSLDEKGPEHVKRFVAAKSINYPVAMSPDEVTSKFGEIRAIPTTFVIDQEGRLRYKKVGGMETAEFETLIKPLLN